MYYSRNILFNDTQLYTNISVQVIKLVLYPIKMCVVFTKHLAKLN